MHEKRQPMLPSPGAPRLTRPPAGRSAPLCPRMFSRSLLRRRRFYGLLAIFGLALYYFRVLGGLPVPVSGYEAQFAEELNSAMEIAAQEGNDVRYLRFKIKSYPRWVARVQRHITRIESKKKGRMRPWQVCE